MTNSTEANGGSRPTIRLTPEHQAELAHYLSLSRANPAPLAEYAGKRLPLEALMSAEAKGLCGVTQADVRRLVDEIASRCRP